MASVDDEMDDAERDRDRRGSPERRPRDSYRNDDEEEDPRARGKESMELAEEDAAFVLGRGGMTKKKIERACNAVIDVNEREYRIEITGTKSERKRARDYLTFVMQQRVGAVVIDTNKPRDDLTILSVPEDCVAFVMGRGGQTLRTIEEEWATLMFFAKVAGAATSEKLMIFGDLRARRGAELKVMSAIEHKKPGYYVQQGDNGLPESVRMSERYEGDALPPDADWDVDMIPFTNDDFSYALGAQGSTRRKLAKASGCILEYVGMVACIAGTRDDRKRCRDYLRWLLKQRTGPVHVEHDGRTDVIALQVPPESVGFITGTRGETLRQIERNTGTFCFTSSAQHSETGGRHETLLIFSHDSNARARARDEVEGRLHEHAMMRRGGGMGGRGGGGYEQRYDDRRDYDRGRDRHYDDRRDDRRDRDRYDDRRDRRRDDDYDDRYDRRREEDRRGDRRRRDDEYDDRYDRRRRDEYDRYDDRDRRDRDHRHDDRRGRDYDHRR